MIQENGTVDAFINECFNNKAPNYEISYPYGIAIVGGHFGDEGKGKFCDLIIRNLKKQGKKVINIRAQGGGNAGHTVVSSTTGKEYHFHYLPSGGLISDLILLGGGMLLDPIRIHTEASMLPEEQQAKILIDGRATFCTWLERKMDSYYEGKKTNKVGTTGSGVGPAVAYRALRVDIRFFEAKACKNWQELRELFLKIPDVPQKIFNEIGDAYSSFDEYVEELYDAIQSLNIVESMPIIQKTKDEGWSLVLEVSQAFGLDSIFGNSGKFVTSTHTTVAGALADAGLVPADITDGTIIITKAYASKVGSGKFMTKFGTEPYSALLSQSPMEISDFIHEVNGECGVTTGRKRDLGWFDCVAVRAAIQRNGSRKLAINCMDTIGKIPGNVARICVAYEHKETHERTVFWPDLQEDYTPVYKEIAVDWNIKHVVSESKLPEEVWNFLGQIAYYTGADICYIGTGGSDRDVIVFSEEYGKKKINAYAAKAEVEAMSSWLTHQIIVDNRDYPEETFEADEDDDEKEEDL